MKKYELDWADVDVDFNRYVIDVKVDLDVRTMMNFIDDMQKVSRGLK